MATGVGGLRLYYYNTECVVYLTDVILSIVCVIYNTECVVYLTDVILSIVCVNRAIMEILSNRRFSHCTIPINCTHSIASPFPTVPHRVHGTARQYVIS